MKSLVNSIQYLVVLVLIYPIYYVWQTDKVTDFCELIDAGMTKQRMIQLGEQASIKMIGPDDISLEGGKWVATVEPGAFISSDICVIKGAGNKVATARLFETEAP
ncbi:hypothetical protein A9Q79_08770 [Methylophaga sp. 42_25_T18]|nr:hypothetical protein A9Q79_08770 [Methylophaga sp. 42_25_T18]OUR87755.1 hypothetical protein A9Q92_03890 [Methylophaga sp. 42_8_T64]